MKPINNLYNNLSTLFSAIVYIIFTHLLCLFFLTISRSTLLFCGITNHLANFDINKTLTAILIGCRFDNAVMSYISATPLLLTIMVYSFKWSFSKIKKFLRYWYFTLFGLLLMICTANVRYYIFFDNHLDVSSFRWFAFPQETFGLIYQDSTNWIFLTVYALLFFLFAWTFIHCVEPSLPKDNRRNFSWKYVGIATSTFALLCGLLFLGMRGSIGRYPLRVGNAYFCENAFYNKLGINAFFHIVKSWKKDNNVSLSHLMSESEALEFVKNCLNIDQNQGMPLVRKIYGQAKVSNKNVVLVLMESMTADNLTKLYNGIPLTPFLRLLNDSATYYFPNFYSAGIHTNNGITATNYGYTPNFKKTTMSVPADKYYGLPQTLKDYGYRTLFFVSGDANYDNMSSFLYDNAYDKVYSQDDYPTEQRVNRWGVPDKQLFDNGIGKLNELHETGQPFLATFLTISNHAPFFVPETFKNRGADESEQIIAYADYCLEDFMATAKKQPWYENTIFIIVADHGSPQGNRIYDMCYQYNHIPCYFIIPNNNEHHVINHVGGQIDIFPTTMGILGLAYSNNTLGVDLLNEKRDLMFFVSDDHIGCADLEFFYCYNINTNQEFLYRIGYGENILDTQNEIAKKMREYALAMTITSNKAVTEKWTNLHIDKIASK